MKEIQKLSPNVPHERAPTALDRVRENWQEGSAVVLLVIASVLSMIPTLRGFAFPLLGLALISLVFMVWRLKPTSAPNWVQKVLKDTAPDLSEALQRGTRRLDPGQRLDVWVFGCRLRSLKELLARVRGDLIRVRLRIYHADKEYLTTEPWPNALNEASHIDLARQEIIALLPAEAEVEFVPYSHPPIFFGVSLPDRLLIFGHFAWDQARGTWIGPSQLDSFVIRRNETGFFQMQDWVLNRCDEWDRDHLTSEYPME